MLFLNVILNSVSQLYMSILRKIYKAVRLRTVSDNWTKKAICLAADYAENITFKQNLIEFKALSISFEKGKYEFLLDAYQNMSKLAKFASVKFNISNEQVFANFPNLKVEVQTAEDIFILKEIYLNREYGFNFREKTIVVDIGLNVAMASLYFALNPKVEHIYSYEPFVPTIEQAKRNIGLNEEAAKKIKIHNYGLDFENNTLEVEYTYEQKGRVGIHGVALVKDDNKKVEKQQIELRNIVTELERITALHPGMPLLCKIDCEGAEYNIFKAFDNTAIPSAVKGILMEWHEKGIEPLIKILERDGFNTVANFADNQKVGMLYAFR
jgi:FkbM family methyltransferase